MSEGEKPERCERCLRNRLWIYNAISVGVFAAWFLNFNNFEANENLWINIASRSTFTIGCGIFGRYSHLNAMMAARSLDLLRIYVVHRNESALDDFRRLQTNEKSPSHTPPKNITGETELGTKEKKGKKR